MENIMITKPEDAKPRTMAVLRNKEHFRMDDLFVSAEECAQIAQAYAQSILDSQSGAYGASEEQERWLDRFSRWMDKKG